MKQKVVKGFTLIELIVVMAIFMIVMVAAMSLMEPVSQKVMLADVRESGTAQVNSISNFLKSELGSAEYLMVTNSVYRDGSMHISDSACQNMVNDYVKRYYEGVLKKGATAESPIYGSGKVHVLTIDNAHGGEITTRVYDVNFDLNSSCGTYVERNDNAINKAYYENTEYNIVLGDPNNAFDPGVFLQSVSATDTTFTITAKITRGTANPKTYEFTTTSTIPLVNIMERPGPVTGKYFVVKESGTVGGTDYKAEIVDLGKDAGILKPDTNNHYTKVRSEGSIENKSSIWVVPEPTVTGAATSYTFVYSYGNEMKTS